MDQNVRQLLDALPCGAPRSKLEPHWEVIRELRRKRWTYRRVALFFAEHLGIAVAPSTIHAFVAVRAKRGRKRSYELPAPGEAAAPVAAPAVGADSGGERTDDPIAILKRRRPPEGAFKPRFQFQEGEALTLSPRTRREDMTE